MCAFVTLNKKITYLLTYLLYPSTKSTKFGIEISSRFSQRPLMILQPTAGVVNNESIHHENC